MSNQWYQDLWRSTQEDLGQALQKDTNLNKMRRKDLAQQQVASLYVRYIRLIQALDECYDQVLQPQKRPLLRRLLDMCTGRLLELKEELTQLDLTEYPFLDETLIEMQCTPYDIEIPALQFYTMSRPEELEKRKKTMSYVLAERKAPSKVEVEQPAPTEEEPPHEEVKPKEETTPKEEITPKEEDKEPTAQDFNVLALEEMKKRENRQKILDEDKKRQEEMEKMQAEIEERKRQKHVARRKLREKWIEEHMLKMEVEKVPENPHVDAVLLIQRHERARQGRLQATVWRGVFNLKRKVALGLPVTRTDQGIVDHAVRLIQRMWRGYLGRSRVKSHEIREQLLLGMVIPSYMSNKSQLAAIEVCKLRRITQTQYQKAYDEAVINEREYFMKVKAPPTREDFTDEIRDWFIEWYNKVGRFPDFPLEVDGGSLQLINRKVITPEEYLDLAEEKIKEAEKNKKDPGRAKRERLKLKEKLKEEKMKLKERKAELKRQEKEKIKEGTEDEIFEAKPSNFVKVLDEANNDYTSLWKNKEDTNPDEKYDLNMIKRKNKNECEAEIRHLVDNFMRLELTILNDALERDKLKRLGKNVKKGKGKKKKGKKKGKKGKKLQDLTGNRTVESLFEELVANDIIRPYPEIYLKDLFGDYSYSHSRFRQYEFTPGWNDVKQLITQYCILPMGSSTVRQLAPLIRSTLIIGTPGSGKHMLAYAICTELGAVMFDLSPKALFGKYEGKAGKKMLLHLIEKMSKILQPSILFVDGAEKPFYKKIPKLEKQFQPRKVGIILKALIKKITVEDQVMLLGITKDPMNSKPQMPKLYDRMVVLPRNGHNIIQLIWQKYLMEYHGVDRNFFITALSTETEGLSLGDIRKFLDEYMSVRRILEFKRNPLTPQELLKAIMVKDMPQITKQETDKLQKWVTTKSQMHKYRNTVLVKYLGLDKVVKKDDKNKKK